MTIWFLSLVRKHFQVKSGNPFLKSHINVRNCQIGTLLSLHTKQSFQLQNKMDQDQQLATFAGGCFWGLQLRFQRVVGVYDTFSGYTQGNIAHPTYQQVCSGTTGHAEAVQLSFSPKEITFNELVDIFFDRINPLQVNGQGGDHGTQYRTGIYFHTDEQRRIAEEKKNALTQKLQSQVATEILPSKEFYRAEEYHQKYLEKKGQSALKNEQKEIRCYG